MRRASGAALAGVLALATVALPAVPGARAITNAVTAVNLTYVPSSVTIRQGDKLDFTNLDRTAPHDVVSREAGLFASDIILGVGTTPVRGVDVLSPGDYAFFCTIHDEMKGTLSVVEDAVPLPVEPPSPPAVDVVGGVVPTPTSLTVRGGAVYVASWQNGTVSRLPILPEGLLGPPVLYASGFEHPLGIAFGSDGTLFVSDSHASVRPDRAIAGRVQAVPPGGGDAAAVGRVVIDELPNGRHNTNGMAVGAGRLYITNGNSTDDGVNGGQPEEPLSGTLISVPLSATGLTPASPEPDLVVEARGMRNNFDVAFRPGAVSPEAWMTMNGLDAQEPFGEDLLLKATIAPLLAPAPTSAAAAVAASSTASGGAPGRGTRQVAAETIETLKTTARTAKSTIKGAATPTATTTTTTTTTTPTTSGPTVPDFGFPGCVHGEGSLAGVQNRNSAVTDVCDGSQTPPEALMGLHVSANGLAFGPADGYWDGDLFIAEYGSNPGELSSGHKVVRVPIDADGRAGAPTDVVASASPLDVAFGPHGLYVADFATGQILLLRAPAG